MKLSKALFTDKQLGSLSRGLKIARLYKRNLSGRVTPLTGLNSARSVSININKTRKHFSATFMARPCFSNVFQFAYGKHCFQCQLFSSRCKLWLPYTAGNFKENPSMRAPAKIFRARASEHSSNFCEQFEQRPNFASTFKLNGTI